MPETFHLLEDQSVEVAQQTDPATY